jgi:ABC-type transporter Mla maintaining outer membrane lipid asymmetry ATPase subunit MlaF
VGRTGTAVDPVTDLYDVTTHFGEPHVPQGDDLAFGRGEVVLITGPSERSSTAA